MMDDGHYTIPGAVLYQPQLYFTQPTRCKQRILDTIVQTHSWRATLVRIGCWLWGLQTCNSCWTWLGVGLATRDWRATPMCAHTVWVCDAVSLEVNNAGGPVGSSRTHICKFSNHFEESISSISYFACHYFQMYERSQPGRFSSLHSTVKPFKYLLDHKIHFSLGSRQEKCSFCHTQGHRSLESQLR